MLNEEHNFFDSVDDDLEEIYDTIIYKNTKRCDTVAIISALKLNSITIRDIENCIKYSMQNNGKLEDILQHFPYLKIMHEDFESLWYDYIQHSWYAEINGKDVPLRVVYEKEVNF